jgi:hypothetical protein
MKTRYLLIMLLLGSSSAWTPAWAKQTCDTKSYPMSTPVDRFTDNGDGTLFDLEPDLTWMRCSLGQVWTGKTCTGKPATYTWKSAQEAAAKLNREGGYANHDDWRVPQIGELGSIVERQCSNPRINLALFPATPPAYFWTATTRRGPGMDAYAYAISFGAGGPEHPRKEEKFDVRLVRGGAPKE